MAESKLAELYTAILSLNLSLTGYPAIQTRDIDDHPTKINSADLPMRIAVPLEMLTSDYRASMLTIGRTAIVKATWSVMDILLIKSTALGRGPTTAELVEYMGKYAAALTTIHQTFSDAGIDQFTVESVLFQPDIWPWPLEFTQGGAGGQGMAEFSGVGVLLLINENIPV